MSNRAAIEIEDLWHAYRIGEDVLKGLSLDISSASIVGLLGPNGSGKSTLFRILSTLLPVRRGRVTMLGLDVRTSPNRARQLLGVSFQSPALDGRLTAGENLNCHARIYGLGREQARARATDLLQELDLEAREHSLVSSLSGGLRRRVELAKTLLHQPRILLLDEPTAGLDPASRRDFWNLLRRFRDDHGTTVIVATHLMDEAEYCDHLELICGGVVVASGSPTTLRSDLGASQFRIRTVQPERFRQLVTQSLETETALHGDVVTLTASDPAVQTASLLSLAGTDLISLEIARPTLEDVFLRYTGLRLSSDKDAS